VLRATTAQRHQGTPQTHFSPPKRLLRLSQPAGGGRAKPQGAVDIGIQTESNEKNKKLMGPEDEKSILYVLRPFLFYWGARRQSLSGNRSDK